jgi:putative ubiquitin-RnfH superfamily antitoxin RatB of RatAB toxin-antitoxin module
MAAKLISIEIVYATAKEQYIMTANVPDDSSIADALITSGILQKFPEINLAHNKVGIFGQIKKLTDQVVQGDRIEIYRPLLIDPKQARRLREDKAKHKPIL